MLVLIPILTFLAIFLHLFGRSEALERSNFNGRGAFLSAAVIWGALVAFTLETLNLLNAISEIWLGLAWGAVFLGIVSIIRRSGSHRAALEALKRSHQRIPWLGVIVLMGMGIIIVALFIIAIISPANNADSLLYHMTRVMHWAQNRSLDHYPTAYHHQLMMPPWAEMAILTLRTLWGNDRLANLVQWFSMVGSAVGVSALAAMLGARFRGQLLAAAFALSIPMGVLQATSTQNDYVVAFWLVCLAYFMLLSKKRPLDRVEQLIMAGAVGLGMLTKVTFYIYALPWLVWFLFPQDFRSNRRRFVFDLAAMTLIVVTLNLGYWSRNLSTYGTPFGPGDFVRGFTATEIMPPEAPTIRDPSISKNCTEPNLPWRIYSAEVKMVGRNLITPSNTINQWFRELPAEFPCALGSNYASTMVGALWNHEDTAGNLLHTGLVGVSLVVLGIKYHDARKRYVITYALMSLIGYLLLPVIISNGSSLVGLRFQLPFFVLWGPVFGWAIDGSTKLWLGWVAAAGLIIAAMPWVFLNNTRPLIGVQPWITRLPSILETPPEEILFTMNHGVYDEYLEISKTIRQSDCKDIGLVLDSHDFEYQLWWLLDAPQSGNKLKSIETFPSLERYLDLAYDPCAIICTLCGDRSEYAGMPLAKRYGSLSLYLEN